MDWTGGDISLMINMTKTYLMSGLIETLEKQPDSGYPSMQIDAM